MQQFEDVISAKTKYCFKDFVTLELYYQHTGSCSSSKWIEILEITPDEIEGFSAKGFYSCFADVRMYSKIWSACYIHDECTEKKL